jgi:CRISPR-associated endonuclease/helicase Cas3
MLKSLVANFGATVVFCTATQPMLNPEWMSELNPREIIPEPQKLFDELNRVEVTHLGEVSDDALISKLGREKRVLIIVNTRAHALKLYERLNSGDGVFHLSALMCPEHRTQTLETIKTRLENKERCIVVSTSLIEAGVDIDFPVVCRAEAGLESIAQSAGRCNREDKLLQLGKFYIFKPQEVSTPRYLQENTQFGREILSLYPNNFLKPEAIKKYFEMRYSDEKRLDKLRILSDWRDGGNNLEFNFRTIGENFRLIDEDTQSVIIPFDAKAIELLQAPLHNLRELQRYTVSVYNDAIEKSSGLRPRLEQIADGVWKLKTLEVYNKDTGLILEPAL